MYLRRIYKKKFDDPVRYSSVGCAQNKRGKESPFLLFRIVVPPFLPTIRKEFSSVCIPLVTFRGMKSEIIFLHRKNPSDRNPSPVPPPPFNYVNLSFHTIYLALSISICGCRVIQTENHNNNNTNKSYIPERNHVQANT